MKSSQVHPVFVQTDESPRCDLAWPILADRGRFNCKSPLNDNIALVFLRNRPLTMWAVGVTVR